MVRGGRRRPHPLRGRHERGGGGRTLRWIGIQRRGQPRPLAPEPGVRGRRRLALGAHPGWRGGASARGRPGRAGDDAAPLPAVVRVLDPGGVDRHARGGTLRDALDPHGRPGRVGPRLHAGGALAILAPAGLGRRSQPGPDADRLRGNAGDHHRSLGARAPASHPSGLDRRPFRNLRRRGRVRSGAEPVRASPGQLPADRRP